MSDSNTAARRRRAEPRASRPIFAGNGPPIGHFGIDPKVRAMIREDDAGGATIAASVLEALTRFPRAEQAGVFERYRSGELTGRRLKRYIDNRLYPPTRAAVVGSVLAFLEREFPAVDRETLADALLVAAAALAEGAGG